MSSVSFQSVSGHLTFVGSLLPILPTPKMNWSPVQCLGEHRENLGVAENEHFSFILCHLWAGHPFTLESHCLTWIKQRREEIIFTEPLLWDFIPHNGVVRWVSWCPFYREGNQEATCPWTHSGQGVMLVNSIQVSFSRSYLFCSIRISHLHSLQTGAMRFSNG